MTREERYEMENLKIRLDRITNERDVALAAMREAQHQARFYIAIQKAVMASQPLTNEWYHFTTLLFLAHPEIAEMK